MNDDIGKTWRNWGFLQGGQPEKESDWCVYQRSLAILSREEPGFDFCGECAVKAFSWKPSVGLACNCRNIDSNSSNPVKFVDRFFLKCERKMSEKWLSGMGLPFQTRSFLVVLQIGFLFSLRNLVNEANLFVYCQIIFASSWVGNL